MPLYQRQFKGQQESGIHKKLLDEIGVEGERLEMYNIAASDGPRFAEVAREMHDKITALGPSPIRQAITNKKAA
ncbi:hypothetical protein ES703_87610 [subsurface metagenome]